MGILKKIGIVLLGLISLMLIIGLFQPTHYEIERSTEINASKEAVFSKINDLTTWESWSPFKEEDPTMKTFMGEKTKGLGASYSWDGDEAGKGTMTVTEVDAPTFQKTALTFDGQEGGNGWFKLADAESGATDVTWGWGMDVPYPFNSMMLFTAGSMEKNMNRMFDLGLAKLKALVETEAANAPKYQVTTVDFPGRTYVAMRETLKFGQMNPDFFANRYAKMGQAMGQAKVEMAGQPCGLYFTWDEDNEETEMAAALPVATGKMVKGKGMEMVEVPAGKAYVIDYYGPYEDIGSAHYAMDDYLKANKLQAGAPVIEEYVTDPGTEPDPTKWLTKVYYLADNLVAENQ